MKLAWLCYDEGEFFTNIIILFSEPKSWEYSKIVPIVYAEIIE